ncbi:hypothetical protein FJ365_01380 [Candidatus Dependentiae bacterium]|nr:hypothetical protein [Candidatus Dependentiae bacterium]
MRLHIFFLFAILTYQQIWGATPSVAKRPRYILTNQQRELSLKYLNKREQAHLQQIMHLYQHEGIPLQGPSNTAQRKKILIFLLLLLLSSSLCCIAYCLLKPAFRDPTSARPTHPSASETCGQQIPTPIPHAKDIPQADKFPPHPHKSAAPVSDENLMTALFQAVNAMQETNNNFKTDSVGSLIDSMHKMTHQSNNFASTLHGFMQSPTTHSYGSSSQRFAEEDPFLAAMPQVPQHIPSIDIPIGTGQSKQKPPISVYIPASASNLEARFQNLKK